MVPIGFDINGIIFNLDNEDYVYYSPQEPTADPNSKGMVPIGFNINGIIFNLDKEDYVLG